ncbi:hypothetical protein [Variovorax sp. YR752]|uniref:hypothetical protein n=1 Tax=Variovorax sp. YR752 TaxID=1884383 RepID=UPI0015C9D3A0|nr:hypothetical protein [Variovorax sp. YR752]
MTFEAPPYEAVMRAAIEILDDLVPGVELLKRYGKPELDPYYSAGTELDSIGVNSDVRKLRTKLISKEMRSRFGAAWLSVPASTMQEQETIGAFIILLCGRTRGVAVPFGEPR